MDEIRVGSYLGKYKITGRLGSGGMGVVYRGEEQDLERSVAIKILPDDMRDEESIKRFKREAKAAAILVDDSRIVKIYTTGKLKDGAPYIVMECVEGKLLGSYIGKDVVPDSAAMSWRLSKFQEILEAMAYAHENGVVHRDLKPGNIMIGKSGLVKIMDFGLALVNDKHTQTRTGQFMGSLPYASPEQIKPNGQTDNRTDIYSLGVILYELLTGQLPFTGGSYEVMFKVVAEPAPSVRGGNPGGSEALSNVVARCLEKEPDKRFQSVRELLASFKACTELQGIAKPGGSGGQASPGGNQVSSGGGDSLCS